MWKTEEKVCKFVEKYKMISPGDRVVAAQIPSAFCIF